MTIYTVSDIDRVYNDTVVNYMNKGYVVSPFTHSGSVSGSESHIDMIKPNDKSHLIRIWLISGTDSINVKGNCYIDTISICVNKYTYKFGGFRSINYTQSLWPDCGETISDCKFYLICSRPELRETKAYVDNIEEAKQILEMQWKRYCDKCNNAKNYHREVAVNTLSPKFIDNIMERINAIKGFKRATASCLKDVVIDRKWNGHMVAAIHYSYNDKNGIMYLR